MHATEQRRELSMEALTKHLTELLHRWFIRFNPLYLLSASCVLLGIFLLSESLERSETRGAEILLTLVVQLYEFLLLGAAALLYRLTRQGRPVVLLTFIALFYNTDPTLRAENSVSFALASIPFSLLFPLFSYAKLQVLERAFSLRITPSLRRWFLAQNTLLAMAPLVLFARVVPSAYVLLAVLWIQGLLSLWGWNLRTSIATVKTLPAEKQEWLQLASKVIPVVFSLAGCAHLFVWHRAAEQPITGLVWVSCLLLASFATTQRSIVLAFLATAFAAAFVCAPAVHLPLSLCAIVFAAHGVRLSIPRLHLAALLTALGVSLSLGLGLVALFALVLLLALLGWRCRLGEVFVLGILALAYHTPALLRSVQLSPTQRGGALVFSGFLLLALGVTVNVWLSRTSADLSEEHT